MDVTTRIAGVNDEPELARIDGATWSPHSSPASRPTDGRAFLEEMHPSDEVVVATGAHGAILGWVIVGPEHQIESNAHVRALKGLAVDPPAHGTGVGRRLVTRACELAREAGASRIRSRVLATNPTSLRLHQRCGFHVEGILRGEFIIAGERVDDVLLARPLAP